MTEKSHQTETEAVAQFAKDLKLAATSLSLPVTEWPEIAGRFFRGDSSPSTTLDQGDLPNAKQGISIGRYAIVLGVLPEIPTVSAIRETLRRYRNQCVVARSFLSVNQALDLQLMLVGPRGSERDAEWRSLALMVERDDRVARKLAWLRPDEQENDARSFSDFVRRTFLARPWEQVGQFSISGLDRLNTGQDGVESRIPRDTAEEWDSIALRPDADPAHIVAALVDAWKRRSQ
ncbi:hypothetical protein LMG22037_05132 [Paraburkholderia phenoliruptrix]|uniref:Uncharacterized protein n=1 Tax=Paraburkholderia phenoliruptrix TaxID=252970 RepID=A0A6J5C302_9BURK|nr:ABC-three component system middle component 1 [Paraburkholderia phenoliruptrix]CAB3725561.1 hypothetical protein LMG22037_05132 [Paraburkholderia phenoliruptrix]